MANYRRATGNTWDESGWATRFFATPYTMEEPVMAEITISEMLDDIRQSEEIL